MCTLIDHIERSKSFKEVKKNNVCKFDLLFIINNSDNNYSKMI